MVATVYSQLSSEEKQELFFKQQEVRTERYTLQSVAKNILPNERVSICLRTRIKKRGEENFELIKIWKHRETHKAFLSGLAVCGSVWTCPVCASKISERRKSELNKAIIAHRSNNGHMAMLTLTIRHKRNDKLELLLDSFNKAVNKLMSGKAYNNIRQELGIKGRVKALEVTHGVNGWHPHAHIVIFYENEVKLSVVEKEIYRLWFAACKKFGLSTTEEYGIDLQGAEHVQAYLTKQGNWTIEQEMTKAHIKKGRESNLTPFDLLRDVLQNDDEYSKGLFKEYALAFKGKRQLHWSRGLKDYFNINEKSDEEVAKEKVENADMLGLITFEQWKQILRADQRAQLLMNIERYGYDVGLSVTLKLKKVSSSPEDTQGLNEIQLISNPV